MTLKPSGLILCAAVFFVTSGFSSAEDILLYSGPPFSIPDSTPVTPVPEPHPAKELRFQREFVIDKDVLESLPRPVSAHEKVAVTAIEAIEISQKDVDPKHALQTLTVTGVQLLQSPDAIKHRIEYYLVSMLANGSEEHRIVLMNRSILAPKLKRLKE